MQNMFSKFWRVCRHGWVYKNERTWAIMFMAYFSTRLILGYLILPPSANKEPRQVLTFLENFAPLQVFGAAWAFCFVVCCIQAFRKRDSFAMTLFACLNFLWFLSYAVDYFTSIINGEYSRAWLSGLLYLGLGLMPALVISKIPNPYALEIEGEQGNVFRQ